MKWIVAQYLVFTEIFEFQLCLIYWNTPGPITYLEKYLAIVRFWKLKINSCDMEQLDFKIFQIQLW
jgi:hypothetical protein